MSKQLYFSQYESPNIVIVPTVSLSSEPPAKKTKLANPAAVEKKTGVACERDKNLQINSANQPNMNFTMDECMVKKHPNNIIIPCGAVSTAIGTDGINKKPMEQETKKNTSSILPLADVHPIMDTVNMNEHTGKRTNLISADIHPSHFLNDNNGSNNHCNKYISFPEYIKNKKRNNSTSNNDYITKQHQTNSDEVKKSTCGKFKRKITETKSKIIKKKVARNVIDKNSDSDFEEQKFHNKKTKSKIIDCLESHNVNTDTSKTDKKKTDKLVIAKTHQKPDKKYEPDKSSNIFNANKVFPKTISDLPSPVATKYKTTKIRRKQIAKSKKEQTSKLTKINCEHDTKDKIQSTSKPIKPSLKKTTQCMKATPIKSVVQVTKYYGLTPSKKQYRPARIVDLRTKIHLKNQTNMENYSRAKQNQIRDNLRITVNNLNAQTEDRTKVPEKTAKSKFERCKKINLIINVICQKRLDESLESLSSEASDSDDNENDSSCVLPTGDLGSFLDDINVDEIVESLKNTKNDSIAKASGSSGTSDIYKLDLPTEITIKTEKENTVAQNDSFINKENCGKDIIAISTENKNCNNKRLSDIVRSNNEFSTEHEFIVQNKYKTDIAPTVDIKQEIINNDCQQKDIQTFSMNSIKIEDDTISECSTVIIGELIHSDNGEETFDNIDENFTKDDFPNRHTSNAEIVSIQPEEVEVDITANQINETHLVNLSKNSSGIKKECNTSHHEYNTVLNVIDENKDKAISEIKHEPTALVNDEIIIILDENDEGEHNSIPELETVQCQADSDRSTNISSCISTNIEKELSMINNEGVHEEHVIESNEENFNQNSATTETIRDDILENQTALDSQVVDNVSDAIVDACSIPISTNNGIDISPTALNTSSVGISETQVIADIDEKCVNENNKETPTACDKSVMEVVTEKPTLSSPIVQGLNDLNSMKEDQHLGVIEKKNKTHTADNRSVMEVVTKKPLFSNTQDTEGSNSMNMEDQSLSVNENKMETLKTDERNVTEVVTNKPLLPSPKVQGAKYSNSMTIEHQNVEKKTATATSGERSGTEVIIKKPLLPSSTAQGMKTQNSLNPEDQNLAQNLEKRMSDYLKKKYSVMSVINNGRFGRIFRCQDTNGQNYALKILNNECDRHVLGVNKEQMHMAIQKEIPRENYFCVYIINGFSLNGYWCFLMEYYPKNLEEALRNNKKSFHIDVVQKLSRQLISAVTMLRNHHVIHSDISPHHVLVNSTNDRLKVCGFDRSFYIDNVEAYPTIGTPSYRPPEVILGFSAGFSLDVWSTALVMYQMATNIKLFPGVTNNDILYKQLCTVGNMPLDMVQQSWYRNHYFVDNGFIRRYSYRGQDSSIIFWAFKKSDRINRTIFTTYHRDWRSGRTMNQQSKDMAKLNLLLALLQKMLVMDPRHRLPIEFAFADPFIYEAYYM